jgi:hypothetical protein
MKYFHPFFSFVEEWRQIHWRVQGWQSKWQRKKSRQGTYSVILIYNKKGKQV